MKVLFITLISSMLFVTGFAHANSSAGSKQVGNRCEKKIAICVVQDKVWCNRSVKNKEKCTMSEEDYCKDKFAGCKD